jgi:hypothetical protein
MRKIIQHIDERNWRTLEYFRMLDKTNKLELEKKRVTYDILVRYFHTYIFILFKYIYVYIRNPVYNLKMKISKIFITALHNV